MRGMHERWLVVLAACAIGCGSSEDAGSAAADGGNVQDAASAIEAGTDAAADTAGDAPADVRVDAAAPPPPGFRGFTFVNKCAFTVWVGALGNPVAPPKSCAGGGACGANQVCDSGNHLCTWIAPGDGGFQLDASTSKTLFVPSTWGGRFWPRTGCANFNAQGVPACATGDCAGKLQCAVGVGGKPPATLAEFTLIPPGQPVGVDFYDVSSVDGANIGVAIAPAPGTLNPTPPQGTDATYWCKSPGAACAWNLAATCPDELKLLVNGTYAGCRSANQVCATDPGNATLACAQTKDLYGCVPGGPNNVSGSCYSNGAQSTCCGCPSWSPAAACKAHNPAWELPSRPEKYAKVFKDACPSAYSFPYDDPTSTFTCAGTAMRDVDYAITFCP